LFVHLGCNNDICHKHILSAAVQRVVFFSSQRAIYDPWRCIYTHSLAIFKCIRNYYATLLLFLCAPGGIKSARVVKQKHTEGAGGKHTQLDRKKKNYISPLGVVPACVEKSWKKKEDVSQVAYPFCINDFIKNTKSAARKSWQASI
jgi:hypothetical protein